MQQTRPTGTTGNQPLRLFGLVALSSVPFWEGHSIWGVPRP